MPALIRSFSAPLAVVALVGLAGAAAACSPYRIAEPTGEVLHPFAAIPGEFARVCVIRTSRIAQAVTFTSLDNGALVGATKGPTFFCYRAEPGEHVLRIEADEPTTVRLQAAGGKSYYLHEKVPFAFMIHAEAEWVNEERARELVEDSTYEIITQTPASEHPPDPIPYARAATR